MSYELLKANLNLYAVLQNLEDLVEYDPEINKMAKDWKVSIQFLVKNGPKLFIEFKDGKCRVGRGKIKRPSVKLFFFSPKHLNSMMDGNGNPIPLKGFTKLGFLTKDFPKVTDKLEYYLKPTDELLKDKKYLEMNTRLTLNTAAFAVPEIALLDPEGKKSAPHISNGAIVMKILPKGPAIHILAKDGNFIPGKGEVDDPTSFMSMKNVKLANEFLNGKIDPFTAIASGDVQIKGLIPQIDSLSLILDRIPFYLE
jgi:hypothetical protein